MRDFLSATGFSLLGISDSPAPELYGSLAIVRFGFVGFCAGGFILILRSGKACIMRIVRGLYFAEAVARARWQVDG